MTSRNKAQQGATTQLVAPRPCPAGAGKGAATGATTPYRGVALLRPCQRPETEGVRKVEAADQWGPFTDALDPAERLAQLRSLRTIVALRVGPRGVALAGLLRRAEADTAALGPAAAAINRLASLDRRHVLASFAAIHRPALGPTDAPAPFSS